MDIINELGEKIDEYSFLKDNDISKNILKGLVFKKEHTDLFLKNPHKEFDKSFYETYNIWNSKESKKKYLSYCYYELEKDMNNAIYYAQTNFLKSQKIELLREYYKTIEVILKKIEIELSKIKFDLISFKTGIYKAFDFELRPKKELSLLPNYLEIEKRIKGIESNNSSIKENTAPDIFKDNLSYTLFEKLHNNYKDDKRYRLANYSFIYNSMKRDGFIICSGASFIRYISELDISIDKIDSRQSGKLRKTPLYDSFKAIIFKP